MTTETTKREREALEWLDNYYSKTESSYTRKQTIRAALDELDRLRERPSGTGKERVKEFDRAWVRMTNPTPEELQERKAQAAALCSYRDHTTERVRELGDAIARDLDELAERRALDGDVRVVAHFAITAPHLHHDAAKRLLSASWLGGKR